MNISSSKLNIATPDCTSHSFCSKLIKYIKEQLYLIRLHRRGHNSVFEFTTIFRATKDGAFQNLKQNGAQVFLQMWLLYVLFHLTLESLSYVTCIKSGFVSFSVKFLLQVSRTALLSCVKSKALAAQRTNCFFDSYNSNSYQNSATFSSSHCLFRLQSVKVETSFLICSKAILILMLFSNLQ